MSSVEAQTLPVAHSWERDDTGLGPGRLRDLMVSRSKAEWILPLDSHNLLDPAHVEIGTRYTEEADIIYQWCRVEDLTGRNDWSPNRLFNPKALVRYNYLPITSLIRREFLDHIGGFQQNNQWSLWLRALQAKARFKCVPEVTWTLRRLETPLEIQALMRGAVQHQWELARFVDFLKGREAPRTILEIGTEKGGTLWLWLQIAAPDALAISVDMEDGPYSGGGYKAADVPKLMTYTNHQQQLRLLRGDSHTQEMLETTKRNLMGRQVDFLFIDGDHTLEGVTQDWEMYSPLVRPGGLVVFHDISQHREDLNTHVKPLWDRLKEDHEHYEFRATGTDWGGIGALVKA